MMPKVTKVGFSPQQLAFMLSDATAREDEGWRKRLIEPAKDKDKDISPSDRNIATIWLSQLRNQFQFSHETFFLAVTNLDRFITTVKVRPKYLKCVALTCFIIASKFLEEEEDVPGTREFIENSDCGCRVQDVVRMERIILTKLDWKIYATTPLEYLQIFHTMAHTKYPKTRQLVKAQTADLIMVTRELQQVLSHYHMAVFSSATLALAILSLDLERVSDQSIHWVATTSQLQTLAHVSTSDLMLCREQVCSIFPKKPVTPLLSNRVYLVKTTTNQNVAKKRKHPASAVTDISNSIKKLHTNDASRIDLITPPPDLVHPGDNESQNIEQPTDSTNSNSKHNNAFSDEKTSLTVTDAATAVKTDVKDDVASDHNSTLDDVDAELEDVYDSDATMTASEGEEEEEGIRDKYGTRLRPLTYAEIVKCGILPTHATEITLSTISLITGNTETCC